MIGACWSPAGFRPRPGSSSFLLWWWQICFKWHTSQFLVKRLHLTLLMQRRYCEWPQYSNYSKFLMFSPKVTPPTKQHALSVAQYLHSPHREDLSSDWPWVDPVAQLVSWRFWTLGDIVWQQSLVQQSQWVSQLLFPNLGFVLILDSFTTNYCGLVEKLLSPAFRQASPKLCLFSQWFILNQ